MQTSTNALEKSQLKTLQIVRAVACTSVVYFHIGSVPCFGGSGYLPCFGGFGVDIFFVLSGFVMAMLVATGETGKHFAMSRVSRIVPLYWVLTTFLLVLAALRPELMHSTTANLIHYLKSIFFIPYFKENGTLMPMIFQGWSLNYEMFFYVCVWLSMLTARKQCLWVTSGLVLVAYLGFGWYADNRVLNRFFGNELIYEFIFGMLVFRAYSKHYKVSNKVMVCAALSGYIFMAVAEANGINGIGIKRLFLYGVPSALLVYSAVELEDVIRSTRRSIVNFLVGVGDASYATYLSHIFVIQTVTIILFQKYSLININRPSGAGLTLLAALLTGAIIYKLVDNPLSRFCKSRMTKLLKLPSRSVGISSENDTSPKDKLSDRIIASNHRFPTCQPKFDETPIVSILKEADQIAEPTRPGDRMD